MSDDETSLSAPSLEFHPLADLFPLMAEDSEEFLALVEDIRRYGQVDRIVLYEGKVLDGRNRFRATLIAGKEPKFRPVSYTEGWPREKAAAFVWSKNWPRRHLSREQRDEVIRKLRADGMTIEGIAAKVGTGRGTVERAIKAGMAPDFPSGKSLEVPQTIINRRRQSRPTTYSPRPVPPPPPHPLSDQALRDSVSADLHRSLSVVQAAPTATSEVTEEERGDVTHGADDAPEVRRLSRVEDVTEEMLKDLLGLDGIWGDGLDHFFKLANAYAGRHDVNGCGDEPYELVYKSPAHRVILRHALQVTSDRLDRMDAEDGVDTRI